jgi:hypothetical protein
MSLVPPNTPTSGPSANSTQGSPPRRILVLTQGWARHQQDRIVTGGLGAWSHSPAGRVPLHVGTCPGLAETMSQVLGKEVRFQQIKPGVAS